MTAEHYSFFQCVKQALIKLFHLRVRHAPAWPGRGLQSTPGTQHRADASVAAGINFASLHKTFMRFVKRVVKTAPLNQRRQLQKGSTHWLRHTHATRANGWGLATDFLRESLGQGDARRIARYYRAQSERRHAVMAQVSGARP
jgi:hypothetical protein